MGPAAAGERVVAEDETLAELVGVGPGAQPDGRIEVDGESLLIQRAHIENVEQL